MSKVPLYFSNQLELKLKGLSGACTDRAKLKATLPAVIAGFLLILLGGYEWFNGFKGGAEDMLPPTDAPVYQPLLSAGFFDLCFILAGLGIIATSLLNWLQYNKYRITPQGVEIIQRRIFKGKRLLKEKISAYTGVRFRVEFFQSGILTKNRYIIELYQKNADKMIPLYISTSDKGVRRKWKDYAKAFKLPAVLFTDEGVKFMEAKNLNKSITSLYKQNLIEDTFDEYERLPRAIAYVRKKDKIVIKIRKIIWDAYNLIAWALVAISTIVLFAAITSVIADSKHTSEATYFVIGMFLAIIVIAVQILFRKEKLVLKRHKIVHTHKYMLFSTKHNQIMKKDIEAIEVTENPATGRCFVSVISNDNTIAFGAKMKIKDLRWLKRFLIHEIIK